jgi:predicted transcriptional regulator of viral defense system
LSILDELAAAGKEAFTSHDFQAVSGQSPQAASNTLGRLIEQGLVDRVARGRYAIRPLGALGTRAVTEDTALAVGSVFAGKAHRIAFRSALDWHGLLLHPTREIIVAAPGRLRTRDLGGRPLRVVVETPERLRIGAIDAGFGAQVSSVERALIECASRPSLAGGVQILATALAMARVGPDSLEEMARALDARSALHRLGSIAEALELDPLAHELEPLSTVGNVISLVPGSIPATAGATRSGVWNGPTLQVS